MVVTPSEYLDARLPAWLDAEVLGRVRYDWNPQTSTGSRLITVSASATDIVDRLARLRPLERDLAGYPVLSAKGPDGRA